MTKAEDITVRVSIPRLRPDVVDDSSNQEHRLLRLPQVAQVQARPKRRRRDEDDTRRIRKA